MQKEYLAWMLCPTSLIDQTPKSLPSQTEELGFHAIYLFHTSLELSFDAALNSWTFQSGGMEALI